VRISHKVDYAVRAMVAIAQAEASAPGLAVRREQVASGEHIPPSFFHDILRALRVGGLLRSTRGAHGGWNLVRPADTITVADVIRAVEGPLASVRGVRPNELPEHGGAEPFVSLWVAVLVALRAVLEHVTVADLATGDLPDEVRELLARPGAWSSR